MYNNKLFICDGSHHPEAELISCIEYGLSLRDKYGFFQTCVHQVMPPRYHCDIVWHIACAHVFRDRGRCWAARCVFLYTLMKCPAGRSDVLTTAIAAETVNYIGC